MENLFLTAAAGIAAIFGGFNGGDNRMPPPVRNEIRMQASTTARGSLDITCVAAATATREAALGSAAGANAQALTSAYSARATALASAYTQTGNDAIKKAVKAASTNFGTTMRSAQKTWRTAQQAAWTQFKTALKACGSSAAPLADSSSASLDSNVGAGSQ